MRLHRFYINQKIEEEAEISISDVELIHQLANVFRFKARDKVIVFDGSGFEYEAEISALNKKESQLKIVDKKEKETSSKNVSLFLSIIKKGNFELAAEKCTEIGVTEIHPIISERSEKKDLNNERLEKIVKEASEQSGRVTLPKVFNVITLEEAVTQAVSEKKECITFHTEVNQTENTIKSNNVAIFIGPEGGWTDKEMELFKKNNFQIKSLGQNVLRAETAAIVSVFSLTSK